MTIDAYICAYVTQQLAGVGGEMLVVGSEGDLAPRGRFEVVCVPHTPLLRKRARLIGWKVLSPQPQPSRK